MNKAINKFQTTEFREIQISGVPKVRERGTRVSAAMAGAAISSLGLQKGST